MSSFPFCDLLDTLRLKQVPIGLADYQAAARLIERWDRAHVIELRGALAALLADSPEQADVIRDTFDALYLSPEPHPPEQPPKRTWLQLVRRHVRPWHVGAALTLTLLLVIGLREFVAPDVVAPPRIPAETPSPTTDAPEPSQQPPAEPLPPPPSVPPPPVLRDLSMLPWLTALVAIMAASGTWALRSRYAQRVSIQRAWRAVLASLSGPFYYAATTIPVQTPAMRKAIGDAATILGRRFADNLPSEELDVEDSLRETLRAGLRPVLVFKTPPLPSTIIVLRDVGSEMRVWNNKIDAFIDQMERSGVVIECWYFEEDASFASRAAHGRLMPLSAVAQRHPGSALLVISTGAGVPSALEQRAGGWLYATRQWEDRAWLTPINHPLYWRPELRRPMAIPLRVFPMTRVGIVAAARALTGADVITPSRPPADVRSVSADDIETMKRLVALVPYPTIDLAQQLRQRFCPSVPEEVLLFLVNETEGRSTRTIRLADAEIRRLLAAERRDSPDQELAARRYLRQVLDASEPAAGTVAHLRWELDRAVQQFHLSALAPGEEPSPASTLERLADGPLGEEVRNAVGVAAAAAAPRGRHQLRKVQARSLVPPANIPSGERAATFGWTWPGVVEPVAGIAAAIIAYVALGALLPFPTNVIEHRADAYALDWVAPSSIDQPGSLIGRRLAADADIPADAELYRDDVRVGSLTGLSDASSRAVSNVRPDQMGAYYQLRSTLPSGNLALSNPVFVPGLSPAPPTPPSTSDPLVAVTIDFRPWARVRIVPADQQAQFQGRPLEAILPQEALETPFTIALPPGSYELIGENGGVTTALRLPIVVEPGQPQFISRPMPGFDPDRVVDSLLSGAKQ
jgi:hypothetical protein